MTTSTAASTDSHSTDPVLLEVDGGVATIRLNRPEAMNGLDLASKQRLREVVEQVAADEAVRCVVLTGSGRAFCVGQDLKEHLAGLRSEDNTSLANTVEEHYNPTVHALATMAKPVIAAVNGVAAGAGASYAFAADFRILVDTAAFNTSFTGVALSCDTGASWTLPRLVGRAKAMELLYFPRNISAAEALELGLATQVVTAEEFEGAVRELATRLAAGPTLSYGSIRQAVANSAAKPFDEALAFEADKMALTGASADHLAAVDAFLAKEKPTFTGR